MPFTTKQYGFSFEELGMEAGPILSLMGYASVQAPAPVIHALDKILNTIGNNCDIKGGYILTEDLVPRADRLTMDIAGKRFSTGKIISARLRNASQAAVFLCTLGEYRSAQSNPPDPLESYISDMIASEAVEKAMDLIQKLLKNDMGKMALNTTNRYSPGYCGWPIDDQHTLFSLLPKNFCGVTLTNSALMIPEKSVSGVIGIGKNVKKVGYTCQICDMKQCIYRNRKS